MTVKSIECNVTIACAPYCRKLSMSTGKHGKIFGGRGGWGRESVCVCVCVCVYMCACAEGICCEGDWIGMHSTSSKLNSGSF